MRNTLPAESERQIAVALPATSARRASAYVVSQAPAVNNGCNGQMIRVLLWIISCWAEDLPTLAFDGRQDI